MMFFCTSTLDHIRCLSSGLQIFIVAIRLLFAVYETSSQDYILFLCRWAIFSKRFVNDFCLEQFLESWYLLFLMLFLSLGSRFYMLYVLCFRCNKCHVFISTRSLGFCNKGRLWFFHYPLKMGIKNHDCLKSQYM